jgi:Ca-activated chloride channel family protein
MEGAVRIMKRFFCLALSIVFLAAAAAIAQPGRKKVHQGNKLYTEKKYDAALNKYQDALLEDPNAPITQFNIAAAAYKKNNYDKAMESCGKTLKTEDVRIQSKTYYNMGNTFYRQNKLAESIQSYEQALKLNPNDMDAKYNLEFVRAKLKENAKPQNQQNQQQQQQQQQQQNQQGQKKDQKDKKQEQQEAQNRQERKNEMSKEQAEQLLNALNENQKKAKQQQMQSAGGISVEKDW